MSLGGVYTWYGAESREENNCSFLCFLSAVSNTLSKEKFGKYLLSGCDDNIQMYSECIVDMWGNISYQHVDFEGFNKSILNGVSWEMSFKEKKIKAYPSIED